MTTAYDFSFNAIDGAPMPLSGFAGKVLLVVNVASTCGLTPQYAGLEALYTELKDQELVVLGVPCNQFLGQEPGSEQKIAEFCSLTYGVDFPMTSKNEVKGKGAHPFYQWMREQLGDSAKPSWNFHKLLVSRNGAPLAAFDPRTEPSDARLRAAIEGALAETS